MPNEDVIRVHDTPANLSANLKPGMFGYDQTNDRFADKRLSDSVMKYVSDDSQQCLLATTQTITGLKTFTQNIITTSGKIIGIDQVGGIKFGASNALRIGPNFTDYDDVVDDALNILGGDQQIIDLSEANVSVLQDGIFASAAKWTFSGDMAFNTDHAEWTYSSGTGYIEQVAADFLDRGSIIRYQWYEFTYTISNASGTLTGEIPTGTAENAIALNMANGSHTAHFQGATGEPGFRLDFTGDAGSSFELDDVQVKLVQGGNIDAVGGLGGSGYANSLKVSSAGNVEISGKIGGYPNLMDPRGLSFTSTGEASLTHKLDIGKSYGESGTRFAVGEIKGVQTVGAAAANMDFDFTNTNGSHSCALIYICAQNTAEDKGLGQLYFATFRKTSAGSMQQVGSEVSLATNNDFTGISTGISASSTVCRITVTGTAGETINWSATVTALADVV